MKNIYFYLLISFLILCFPSFTLADGGMMIWPPTIHINQSAQNAIVAWNGTEEIIMLSIDIESSADATALRVIPLPSNPSEIKEGSFESFEKLVEIMNGKIEDMRDQWETLGKGLEGAPSAGVEITFQERIGAHDVTIVKVNDLDYFLGWVKDFAKNKGFQQKEISSEFREGISNYLKKDIKYFVFDIIEAGQEKESINPLIYHFDSDYLYYPILISGISEIKESRTEIDLFVITEKQVQFPDVPYSYRSERWFNSYGYAVEFTKEELEEVSQELASLFEGEANVRKISLYGRLNDLKRDLMIYPHTWDKGLRMGNFSEEIKALQKTLINEGVWDAEVGATGYFGQITKTALAKFQEKYSGDILKPFNLESGTGYFGSKTKDYFKKLSLLIEEKEQEQEQFTFNQNLGLGMRGEHVKALQEILIKEGVWTRLDVKATGYFGFITQEALIKCQEKYASEILEPLGLKKGTGYFGPSTRSYLNKKYQNEKNLTYCEKDEDCTLVNPICCQCNMGGRKTCIYKDFVDEWNQQDCKGIACLQVYLCDDPEPTGCKCIDNVCKEF